MLEVSEKTNDVAHRRSDGLAQERIAGIPVALSVRIYCHAGQKTPIYDAGKTIAIGPGGAVLTLAAPVIQDELVLLIYPKSGNEAVCRVISVEPSGSGVYKVILEFSEDSPQFWGAELSREVEVRRAIEVPLKDQKAGPIELKEFPIAEVRELTMQAPPLACASASVTGSGEASGLSQSAEKIVVVPESSVDDLSAESNSLRWKTPRLHLETHVSVCFAGDGNFRECTTVNVGASSALLLIPEKVSIGQSLILKNPKSLEQIRCQVRYVKERGPFAIHAGVDFVKEAKKFWGVTFPPEDWDPSERKRPQRHS